MIKNVIMFMIWYMVWIFLSWPPEPKDIIVGAVVSLFVILMTADMMDRCDSKADIIRLPVRLAWFACYALVFIWECLKANVDVAYRVIRPDLPIRPGTIKVKVDLKSDAGLTFLANSVTLTPGTTTVDLDAGKGFLYVHMLVLKRDGRSIKAIGRFQKILKRIFE
ncbi:MAG: Na+/H+ antiporter subunit E [Candidatus Omnitrophica bacterium]|nr:Na+/H+ antiporter subunit E [Candidatus Omnitrophota bacterium]